MSMMERMTELQREQENDKADKEGEVVISMDERKAKAKARLEERRAAAAAAAAGIGTSKSFVDSKEPGASSKSVMGQKEKLEEFKQKVADRRSKAISHTQFQVLEKLKGYEPIIGAVITVILLVMLLVFAFLGGKTSGQATLEKEIQQVSEQVSEQLNNPKSLDEAVSGLASADGDDAKFGQAAANVARFLELQPPVPEAEEVATVEASESQFGPASQNEVEADKQETRVDMKSGETTQEVGGGNEELRQDEVGTELEERTQDAIGIKSEETSQHEVRTKDEEPTQDEVGIKSEETSQDEGASIEMAAPVELKSATVEEPKHKEKISATTSMKTKNEIPAKLQKLFPGGKGIVIGASDGSYVQTLIKGWKASKLVVMDPFTRSPGFKFSSSSARSQEQRYIKLRAKLSGYKNAEVLRSGTEALDGYPRRYFDFAYLDYTHDFTKLAKDLEKLFSKVKRGGIVSGSDYLNVHEAHRLDRSVEWREDKTPCGPLNQECESQKAVRAAVEEFASIKKIAVHTTTDEKFPTWYFIKGSS